MRSTLDALMERTTLGRTVDVSVAGLGCGGHSRLGLTNGGSEDEAIAVVLTGTGSVDHLDQNVRSITAGPLPDVDLGRLRAMFGRVDSVSAN